MNATPDSKQFHWNNLTASRWVGLTVNTRSSRVIFRSSASFGPMLQSTSLLFFRADSRLCRLMTMPNACDEMY